MTEISDPRDDRATGTFLKDVRAWVTTRQSYNTRVAYLRALALWEAHQGPRRAGEPTQDSAVDFREWLRTDNAQRRAMATLTVRRVLAALSSMRAATAPGVHNVFSERSLPRPPAPDHGMTEAVSDEDARRVVEAAGRPGRRGAVALRDRALLQVLWDTGMRRGDVVTAERSGVVRRGGTVVLKHAVKGGRDVETELAPDAATAVTRWLAAAPPSRWVFCVTPGGRAMTPGCVSRVVERAAAAAGLKVHPHQFRAAFITRCLDAGIRIERVQAAAHHRDIKSTVRYDRGARGAGVAAELAALRARDK